jgi:hypothetical protein
MNDSDHYNRLIEAAHARIDRLERLIKNNNNAPTIPSYDSNNFPQDAVYGQIAKDYNNHTFWVYGEDDVWHKIGGAALPWGWCRGLTTLASSSSLTQIDFNTSTGIGTIGMTSGDSDITFQALGSGRWGLSRNTKGVYLASTYAAFTVTGGAPVAGAAGFLNSQWLRSRPLTGGVVAPFAQVPGSSVWVSYVSSLEFLDIDGVNINPPKQGDTALAQNSGQNASVFVSQFSMKISEKYVIGNA